MVKYSGKVENSSLLSMKKTIAFIKMFGPTIASLALPALVMAQTPPPVPSTNITSLNSWSYSPSSSSWLRLSAISWLRVIRRMSAKPGRRYFMQQSRSASRSSPVPFRLSSEHSWAQGRSLPVRIVILFVFKKPLAGFFVGIKKPAAKWCRRCFLNRYPTK